MKRLVLPLIMILCLSLPAYGKTLTKVDNKTLKVTTEVLISKERLLKRKARLVRQIDKIDEQLELLK